MKRLLDEFVAAARRVRTYCSAGRTYKSEWDPHGRSTEPHLVPILSQIEDILRKYEEQSPKVKVWLSHDYYSGYYTFSDTPPPGGKDNNDFEIEITQRQLDELREINHRYHEAQDWLLKITGRKVPTMGGEELEPRVSPEFLAE